MGKKKRNEFINLVKQLANERGIRVGFLVLSDGKGVTGFTTYRDLDDGLEGLMVIRDLLEDLSDGGSVE